MSDPSPTFCPNKNCQFHSPAKKPSKWFIYNGHYKTKNNQLRQRYKCKSCGKGFSSRYFSIDIYCSKRVNYKQLFDLLNTKSGIRDMGRSLKISPNTVNNRINRLARAVLYLTKQYFPDLKTKENFVADGFESFAVSQYFPDNFNLLVGKESQFIYFFDYVTIRRKGKMSERQKQVRELLEQKFRADPKGIQKSFAQLYEKIFELCSDERLEFWLYTDQKPDYVRAIKQVERGRSNKNHLEVVHHQTSSRKTRNYHNPLFAVNYVDRQIRKSLACHVRETLQHTRNVNNGISRMILFQAHHNFFKCYRIKEQKSNPRSHAEVAGVSKEMVDRFKEAVFKTRGFLSQTKLSLTEKKKWCREYITPLLAEPEMAKYALV